MPVFDSNVRRDAAMGSALRLVGGDGDISCNLPDSALQNARYERVLFLFVVLLHNESLNLLYTPQHIHTDIISCRTNCRTTTAAEVRICTVVEAGLLFSE